MVQNKKCACSTLIVWDRLLGLNKTVAELKYTIDPKRQREIWNHLQGPVMRLLKGETPLAKEHCAVDLESARSKIEDAVRSRDLDRLDEGVREMTHKMYMGICE